MWHGIKGFRYLLHHHVVWPNGAHSFDSNSPHGERRVGAIVALKTRAPVLGGNFGVWGGLFSSFDCAVKGIRCGGSSLANEESKSRRTTRHVLIDTFVGRRKIRGMPLSEASSLEAHWRFEAGPKPCVLMPSVAPSSWPSSKVSASHLVECWRRTPDSKHHHHQLPEEQLSPWTRTIGTPLGLTHSRRYHLIL